MGPFAITSTPSHTGYNHFLCSACHRSMSARESYFQPPFFRTQDQHTNAFFQQSIFYLISKLKPNVFCEYKVHSIAGAQIVFPFSVRHEILNGRLYLGYNYHALEVYSKYISPILAPRTYTQFFKTRKAVPQEIPEAGFFKRVRYELS